MHDQAKPSLRKKILSSVIREIRGLTGPELEKFFGNGASLVLARISAWLRLTYLNPKNFISIQLRAVSIFVGASGGQRFLVEFMEVGGALTVMEILQLPYATEDDLAAAMELLLVFADAGPKFKESLCQSGAIAFVADCLIRVTRQTSQQTARDLLYQLALVSTVFPSQGLVKAPYSGAVLTDVPLATWHLRDDCDVLHVVILMPDCVVLCSPAGRLNVSGRGDRCPGQHAADCAVGFADDDGPNPATHYTGKL